jgi:hypothetical protein
LHSPFTKVLKKRDGKSKGKRLVLCSIVIVSESEVCVFVHVFMFLQQKSDWGNLVPRINFENGIKLGFLLD